MMDETMKYVPSTTIDLNISTEELQKMTDEEIFNLRPNWTKSVTLNDLQQQYKALILMFPFDSRKYKYILEVYDRLQGKIIEDSKCVKTLPQLKQMRDEDLFGLSPESTLQNLKQAYKKLALVYHPDKNKNVSGEEFSYISERYQALIKKYEDILSLLGDDYIKNSLSQLDKAFVYVWKNKNKNMGSMFFSTPVDENQKSEAPNPSEQKAISYFSDRSLITMFAHNNQNNLNQASKENTQALVIKRG